MGKLGSLIINVGANTRELNKAMGEVNREIGRTTGNIQKLGKELSMAVTLPIAALGVTAVQAFDKQAKAIAQVEAGLKSTGGAVGFTSTQLQKMASELQNNTLFGDEEILQGATAQLLTFTNITGQQFERTQKAALDLATRLDGDLKGASIQLGKALNDPVKNLSALSRSGIQFSEDQKAVITSLAETGRLAEAQTLILNELDKQYGGSAEAAAKAGAGGIKQLQNAFGDLQEEFGAIIMDFLPPLVNGLKSLVQGFSNMSQGAKTAIVVFSGIAAAAGPVMILIPQMIKGLSLLRLGILQGVVPAVMKMNAVLMANPWILAAAGVAMITYGLYKMAQQANETNTAQSRLNDGMKEAQKMAASESVEVEKLVRKINDHNLSQTERAKALEELKRISPAHFGNLDMEKVKTGQLTAAVDAYRESLLKTAEVKVYQRMLDEAIEKQITFNQEIRQMAADLGITEQEARAASNALGAGFSGGSGAIIENDKLIVELTDKLAKLAEAGYSATGTMGTGFNGVTVATEGFKTKVEEAKHELTDLEYALQQINTLGDMSLYPDLKARAREQRITGQPNLMQIDDEEEDLGWDPDEIEFMKQKVSEYYENQRNQAEQTIAVTESLSGALGSMFGSMATGATDAGEAMKGFAKQAIKTLIGIARANAVAVFSSPTNPANALSGGLATPAVIAGGLALVEGLVGAIAFADGGIVSGPTLGLVGEYSGARNNPEVIAPLDKLKGMLQETSGGGAANVTVTGRISGNDIVLIQEKGANNLRRSRGGK